MPGSELTDYLKQNKVKYTTINHSPAYTASQTAQSAHVSGKNMIKIVMTKMDGELAIVVLPAHERLDMANLKQQCKAKKIELAHEYEFNDKFPGCELGAMPPFGDLYHMDVYMADSLSHRNWIAFNGGTHSELIKMSTQDFLKLVHPQLLPYC